jgi:proline racemase
MNRMNTQQYTTMCGHAIMGAATAVIQTGMVPAVEPETIVVFETPVGLVQTQTRVQEGRAHEVAFNNTPVFVHQLNAPLAVPELGELLVDIVYSGGFFILRQRGWAWNWSPLTPGRWPAWGRICIVWPISSFRYSTQSYLL